MPRLPRPITRLLATSLAGLLLTGCVPAIQVPSDARLIWAGEAVGSQIQFFPDGTWPEHGQLYFVDDATGHVEYVFTVSPGAGNVEIHAKEHRRYRAYFVSQPAPGPTEVITPNGRVTSYNIP
jgi:hypothetical protein